MTYAIIDTKTGERLALSNASSITVVLPDGGTALFSNVGQTEPAHAPRYRMVEVEEATKKPDYPVVEVASEREFKDGKEIVRKTYAPDLSGFTAAIEDHIEAVARERQYSSAVSCVSYLNDPNPAWAAEAQAFVAWRSAVWATVFAALSEVQSGKRQVPTVAELIAELPAIEW